MGNDEGTSLLDKARTGMNLIAWIVNTGSVTVEVFLHGRFGSRYLGIPSALGLFIIPIFGLFFQGHDPRPLILFWWAYLLMSILARIGVIWRGRGPSAEHSRYSGTPRLFRLRHPGRELVIKKWHEPLFVAVLGVLISEANAPLGNYLLFAALCLAVKTRMHEAVQASVDLDMRDALMEQRQRMEQLRAMH